MSTWWWPVRAAVGIAVCGVVVWLVCTAACLALYALTVRPRK